MPQGDRYVTDGALLRCDKGVLVTPLTVLPRPSKVNGRYQANLLDCLPVVNIKPFGACAITHGPCMPVMPFWTQAHPSGRTIGPGPAAPLLESSVCQCGLGGRIGITVLPVPGMPAPGSGGAGVLAAGQELGQQQAAHERAQDAQAHALSNDLKEAAGGLAVFGLVCLAVGFVFPPAAAVGAVALEVSEGLLVAGVAVDVAVAIDHPTQDNWVTVGGDALALAGGYVVGKVIIGPALGALGRALTPAIEEEAAAEAATVAPKPAEVEAPKVEVPLPEGIELNPEGVYGYTPKPGSRYAGGDFTDPEFVAKNREIRLKYLAESKQIDAEVARMEAAGENPEAIARRTVEMRNQQKVDARGEMSPEDVQRLEAGNMKKYGHPVGPTADDLYEKYGSWEEVINKSTQKDEAINKLLGIDHH